MSRLITNAVHLQVARIIQMVSTLISGVLLARSVGPDEFGLYAIVMSVVVIGQGLTSFGLEDLVLARAPRTRSSSGDDTGPVSAFYWQAIQNRACGAGLLAALGATAALAGHGLGAPLGLSGLILGAGLGYAAVNSFATLGAVVQATRYRATSSAVIDASWALSVAAVYGILGIANHLTLEAALLTMLAAQTIASAAYVRLVVDVIRRGRRAATPGRISFGEASAFWANGLLSIGVGRNSDVLAIQGVGATTTDTGLYSAAFAANQTALLAVSQGAGTMFYVGLGDVYGRGDRAAVASAWRLTVIASVLVAAPVLAGIVAFPELVLHALFGRDFVGGSVALVWLAATAVLARLLGGGSNQALLFLAERQKAVLLVRFVFLAVNVIADVLLYPVWGTSGVAAASGLCGAGICFVEFLLARRDVPISIPWRVLVRVTAPFAMSSFGASAVARAVDANVYGELGFGLLGLLVGVGVVLVVRPLDHAELPSGLTGRAARIASMLSRDRKRQRI